jgi:hypothetical protein
MAFATMEQLGQRLGEKVEELQGALKAKRLELCPWEEFGIECEKALTYHQLWINPCQVCSLPPSLARISIVVSPPSRIWRGGVTPTF